jgi:ketosteroid isomerase-like protein
MPKTTALTCTILEIDGYGDLAYTRGMCEQSMVPPGGNEPVKMSAKFLDIRRRQSDGRWLVVRDMVSFDGPSQR